MQLKKILLADDHSFIRIGLMQILNDEYPNLEIKQVIDGESLIREVALHNWDLVITDLDMPGRGGLDALEQIKQIKPQLPVLVLSIFSEDLYAMRVLKAGASGFMNKNTAPYELITVIERIRSGKKYITPEIAEKLLDAPDLDKKPHELLSNREFEILKLLALGKTVTFIAESLSLANTTVSSHRSSILDKLSLSTNSELTRYAIANHIISDL